MGAELGPTRKAVLFDKDGNELAVDASQRLLVSSVVPLPPGSTAEGVAAQGDVSGNSSVDEDYIVPDGLVLTISRFICGGETGGKQSKCALYHSTDGGATDGTLLAFGYLGSSNNFGTDLNVQIAGSGTNQVVRLRRQRLDGGSKELAASWAGSQTV